MAGSMAVAYNLKKRKKMAEGGDVEGGKTSTTGNKTKTGGSNPGGASTGGAGTVTITTGAKPPQNISVIGVGGRTAARNAGGMDPSDENDSMMGNGESPEAGEADDKSLNQYMAHGGDIVSHIINKRKMMSEGGMVANGGEDELSSMADGSPNNFDDLALRDDLESTNSGASAGDFLGNESEDEDRADILARIMKQRAMKQLRLV